MPENKRVFKTKKILSSIRSEFRGWKAWDVDDRLVGKLLKRVQNRKNKSKYDYIFEVLDCEFSDRKEQKRIIAGKNVTLNSNGMLDKAMDGMPEGVVVEITYLGQKKMEGGDYEGEMSHTVQVHEVEEDDGSGDADSADVEDDEDEENDL